MTQTLSHVNPDEKIRIFFDLIEESARFGLLKEVYTTPKPGLVDLKDSGAHQDMDCHTFEASAEAIVPYIKEMALAGFEVGRGGCHGLAPDGSASPSSARLTENTTAQTPLSRLFPAIRPIGVRAEEAMFAATGGVNTHKGMIFSLGIIAAAIGCLCAPAIPAWDFPLLRRPGELLALCGQAVSPYLSQDFEQMKSRPPKTHGERLFARYGIRGIRGEAMDGFPSLANLALPAMRRAAASQPDANAASLHVLLTLMSRVDDTNILTRSNPETLSWVKEQSRKFLDRFPLINQEAIAELEAMNRKFIARKISPGGCADLLAIALFFKRLGEGI